MLDGASVDRHDLQRFFRDSLLRVDPRSMYIISMYNVNMIIRSYRIASLLHGKNVSMFAIYRNLYIFFEL